MKSLKLVAALAPLLLSCTEIEPVSISAAKVTLTTCNNSTDPGLIRLFTKFSLENESDEAIEAVELGLHTEGDGPSRVEGTHTIRPVVTVQPGTTQAFECMDGFTVSYPGENTLTDIRMEVTYRQGDATITTVHYLKMEANTVWDECGSWARPGNGCRAL